MATTCNTNEQQEVAKNNAELKTKWTKTTWKAFEKIIRRRRKRLHSWRLMIMMMTMMTPKVKVSPSELAVTRGESFHHYKNKLPELWYGRLNCAEMKRAGRKWILVSIVFRQRVVGTHSINLTLFELQGLYRHIALHADSTVSDGGNINNYCADNARESEKFHLSYRELSLTLCTISFGHTSGVGWDTLHSQSGILEA
jgi:hypothetical protein